MSAIILFYQNKIKANNKEDYYLKDILKWSDYKLEVEEDFIQWLFPQSPNLSKKDIDFFRTDVKIRKNVVRATARMLLLYGFVFVKDGVKQVKTLARKEKGIYVGLYSEKNYKYIARMMFFLNEINMNLASALIMLAMCFSMHTDLVLRAKIKNSGSLRYWFLTQKYLLPYIEKYDIDIMGVNEEKICKFTGLKYTGNSCYQDSTMLALFAIPNEFITRNILQKNIKPISSKPNRQIICGNSSIVDYQRRQAIQKELVLISKSIRGEIPDDERVQYCSKLRGLLRSCPSSSKQKFYSTETQDAGEFLQYLFAIFEVDGIYRTITTDLTNDLSIIPDKTLKTRKIEEEISPIILIPALTLMQIPKMPIDFYLTQIDDSVLDQENLVRGPDGKKYQRRIEKTVVTEGDYIVFYAQRLIIFDGKPNRIYSKIIPNEKLEISGNKQLNLFAIVVHRNVHYTCYIKCDDKNWFYYDDIRSSILLVGTYEDMLEKQPSAVTEGVLYFYKA